MPLDAKKLRQLREDRGITQADAAKVAKMASGTAWSDFENQRRTNPSVATLEGMAKALGVKPADLLTAK